MTELNTNDRLNSVLDDWSKWGIFSARPEIEDIQPVAGGLTNKSFLLSNASDSFILRLNGDAKIPQ